MREDWALDNLLRGRRQTPGKEDVSALCSYGGRMRRPGPLDLTLLAIYIAGMIVIVSGRV